MTEHIVATKEQLRTEGRILVTLEGIELAVFDVNGEVRAYRNWCPHQSGPVCEGRITGTWTAQYEPDSTQPDLEWNDGDILNCPWHGWEFNVKDGTCLSRSEHQLQQFDAFVREDSVIIDL